MTSNIPDEQTTAENDWLALRYLLHELTAAEVADFENRLADDLALGEALARAVLLMEHLDAVPDLPVPTAPNAVSSRSRWVGVLVGLAASLLLGVGLFHSASQRKVAKPEEMLVSYWRDGSRFGEIDVDWPSETTLANLDDNSPDSQVLNEAGVPAWLMLAVRAESRNAAEAGGKD